MKNRKTILILTSLCISLLLFACNKVDEEKSVLIFESSDELVEAYRSDVNEISAPDFKALMDNGEYFVLIDVREPGENAVGFIPGAISIPRGVIEFRIQDEAVWDAEGMYVPAKEDKIVLYCKKDHRGTLSAASLKQLGYTNVYNLSGGYLEWINNYPDLTEKIESTEGAVAFASSGGGGC